MRAPSRVTTAVTSAVLAVLFAIFAIGLSAQQPTYDDLLARARAALATKDYQASVTASEQAIRMDERRWEAYAIAANAYSGQRFYDEAVESLQAALARAPDERKQLIRDALQQVRSQTTMNPAPAGRPTQPSQQTSPPIEAAIDRKRLDFIEGARLINAREGGAARDLFGKWAATGDADAMAMIGIVYEVCVPYDRAQARQWYEKAAAAGSGIGMLHLGDLYSGGLGVPQDYILARQWYEKGAAAGSVAAMHLVGLVYELGHGVPQDYEKARQWYERAAVEKGGVGSALRLGMIYEQGGPGLARGLVEARRWYQNAAAKGNAMAKTRLDQLQGPQR